MEFVLCLDIRESKLIFMSKSSIGSVKKYENLGKVLDEIEKILQT